MLEHNFSCRVFLCLVSPVSLSYSDSFKIKGWQLFTEKQNKVFPLEAEPNLLEHKHILVLIALTHSAVPPFAFFSAV